MIKRTDDLQNIKMLQDIFPVVGILGARQSGKTTIARQFDYDHYFDLENPRDLAKLPSTISNWSTSGSSTPAPMSTRCMQE